MKEYVEGWVRDACGGVGGSVVYGLKVEWGFKWKCGVGGKVRKVGLKWIKVGLYWLICQSS